MNAPTIVRVSDIARRRNACPRRMAGYDRIHDARPRGTFTAKQIVGQAVHAMLADTQLPMPAGTTIVYDRVTRTPHEAFAQARACTDRIRSAIDDHFPDAEIACEVELQHNMRRPHTGETFSTITGRADVVLTLPGGRRAIGEIKTGDSPRSIQNGLLQAAIYAAIAGDLDRTAAVFVAHAPRDRAQCTVHSRHAENGGLQTLITEAVAAVDEAANYPDRFLPEVIRPSATECNGCKCSSCAFHAPVLTGTEEKWHSNR